MKIPRLRISLQTTWKVFDSEPIIRFSIFNNSFSTFENKYKEKQLCIWITTPFWSGNPYLLKQKKEINIRFSIVRKDFL